MPLSDDAAVVAAARNAAAIVDKENNGRFTLESSEKPRGDDATSVPPPAQQQQQKQKQPNWNAFVRQGTLLKTAFVDAMHTVPLESHKLEISQATVATQPRRDDHAAAVAREATAQVTVLQQQLTDSKSHVAAMEASNSALRDQIAHSEQRLATTMQALKVAGANATQARRDASAAETTAATLRDSFQTLQTAVDDTKRVLKDLQTEQATVAQAAQNAQVQVLQQQSAMAHMQHVLQSLRIKYETLQAEQSQTQQSKQLLEQRLQLSHETVEELQRHLLEQRALEAKRQERVGQLEDEYRSVQSLLNQATQGQRKGQELQQQLHESVQHLSQANQDLHAQLKSQMSSSRQTTEQLQASLMKAEKQVQQLKVQLEANNEALEKGALDKSALEQQVKDMHHKLSQLEQRATVTPSDSVVTPFTAAAASTTTTTTIPQEGMDMTNRCCICFKASMGVMKKCECGNKDCGKRAHLICANRIVAPAVSVAHPGTPAPKLALVLCSESCPWSKPKGT